MQYDETELIGFFGVMPEKADPEEREFFGSCAFEVLRGDLILRVSFSSTHFPKVIAELLPSAGGMPIMYVEVGEAVVARVESSPQRLVVLAASEKGGDKDSQLDEKVTVSLDPLSVTVSA